MNIIRKIILRLATMPRTRAFLVGAVDNAEERANFRGMLVEIFGAGTVGSAIAFVLFANVLMAPLQNAPVAGPVFDAALPDEVNIVARAPGTDPAFALNFCKDPAAKAEISLPAPEDMGRITLSRGTDTLSWPGGSALTARYQTSNDGADVDMTPESVACFTKKAGR